MYKLYYLPGACSLAMHVVLNELNVPFEAINVGAMEGRTRGSEFLKVNPRGQVPVLVDGDLVLREGAAIFMYLFSKHPNALWPTAGRAHVDALEWLMFANATLHPACSRIFFIIRNMKDSPEKEALLTTAINTASDLWHQVDQALEKKPFVCGDHPTAADILLTVMANWSGAFPKPIVFGKNVKKMLKAISSRPAYQKSMQTEGVSYKVDLS